MFLSWFIDAVDAIFISPVLTLCLSSSSSNNGISFPPQLGHRQVVLEMSTNRALRFLSPSARDPPRASLSDAIVKISGSNWADKAETDRREHI